MKSRVLMRAASGMCVLALTVLVPTGGGVGAQGGSPVGLDMFAVPAKFQVTINSCSISSDGGASFITLFSTPQSMDVASVAPNSTVTDFVSGVSLPTATYNLIRCIVSGTAVINGAITDTGTGTTYYTDPTVSDTNTGTDPAGQADITVSGTTQTFDIAVNLQVVAGQSRQVRIDFDLSQAIELHDVGGGGRIILPNSDGFDVSLTVLG